MRPIDQADDVPGPGREPWRAEMEDLYAEFRRYKGADLYLFAARATCPRQFATNRPPDWTRADFLADDGPVGLPRAFEIGHRPVAKDAGLSVEREHPAPGEHVYVRLALYGRDEAAVGPFLRLAGGADEARRRAEGRIGITSDPYPPEAQAREWLFHLAAPVLDLPRDPAPVEPANVALAPFTREAPPDVERAMGVRRGIIYPDVFHLSCRAIERLLGGEPEPREPWTLRIHEDRQPRPRHQLARILLDEADDEHSAELVQVLSGSADASNPIRIGELAKLLDKGRGITPVNARQRIKKARKAIFRRGLNPDWEIKCVDKRKGLYCLLEKRLGLDGERRV